MENAQSRMISKSRRERGIEKEAGKSDGKKNFKSSGKTKFIQSRKLAVKKGGPFRGGGGR